MAQEIVDRLLNELVAKLERAYGPALQSVILYGSAATGEWHPGYSDLNVMAVLDRVGADELDRAEKIFHWWRGQGNPSPLLMSADEVRRSTDCFPIEFHDMAERRRILYGADPIAGLEIDDRYYRAQVEHELRAKLLRLRQKAGGVLHDARLLLRLMLDSVSTFVVLGRHALRLAGRPAPWSKHAVVERLRQDLGVPGEAFDALLRIREGAEKGRPAEARALFEKYLSEISLLADAVDRLEERGGNENA
ncbi:MAG: nucleotidyltransferase domain-containing protein [Bryobacteraceae bacterium]|nr:nucleotidyltransferase domain-containing protein [Bryobacteraceae bacterium]MCX7603800.1 nucleotidyltransferase domain-containing protein [Bryobacteraceae bacterium]